MPFLAQIVLTATVVLALSACGGGGEDTSSQEPVPREPYVPMVALSKIDVSASGVAHAAGLLALSGYGEVSLWDTADLRIPRKVGAIEGRVLSSGTASTRDSFGSTASSDRLIAVSMYPACLGFCRIDPGSIEIYDVSRPEQPTRLASIPDAASHLLIEGHFLYVLRRPFSFPTSELQILDISTPAVPRVVANLTVASAFTFVKRANALYFPFSNFLGTSYGLQVVDVSNPQAPRIVRTEGTPVADAGDATAAVSSSRVFWSNGRQEIGSMSLEHAEAALDIPLGIPANALATTSTDMLLVAAGAPGLKAYLVQASGALTLSATMPTPYPAGSVKVFGTVGVIQTRQLLDCSTPPGCSVLADPKVVLFSTTQ